MHEKQNDPEISWDSITLLQIACGCPVLSETNLHGIKRLLPRNPKPHAPWPIVAHPFCHRIFALPWCTDANMGGLVATVVNELHDYAIMSRVSQVSGHLWSGCGSNRTSGMAASRGRFKGDKQQLLNMCHCIPSDPIKSHLIHLDSLFFDILPYYIILYHIFWYILY